MSIQTTTEFPAAIHASDPMLPYLFRVVHNRAENADTFTLDLVPERAANIEKFSFRPGQFNMLYAFGVGESAISISGHPEREDMLIHTIRAVGSVTRALRSLKPGDRIGVRGPLGTEWPLEAAVGNDVLLVAGGIGLAPLRPALYNVLANRERFGKVVVLIGARTAGDLIYRKELERWRSHLDIEVAVTVDRATGDWRGHVGVVTTLLDRSTFDPLHVTAMLCGPEIMMRFTAAELLKRGVVEQSIYLSMERSMKCGIGLCGHCQYGSEILCVDGPVYRYDRLARFLGKREV